MRYLLALFICVAAPAFSEGEGPGFGEGEYSNFQYAWETYWQEQINQSNWDDFQQSWEQYWFEKSGGTAVYGEDSPAPVASSGATEAADLEGYGLMSGWRFIRAVLGDMIAIFMDLVYRIAQAIVWGGWYIIDQIFGFARYILSRALDGAGMLFPTLSSSDQSYMNSWVFPFLGVVNFYVPLQEAVTLGGVLLAQFAILYPIKLLLKLFPGVW